MNRPVSRVALVGVVSLVIGSARAGTIDPVLEEVMAESQPGEVISTLVYLADRVDPVAMSVDLDAQRARIVERHEFVVRALQDKAAATQGDLLTDLEGWRGQGLVEDFKTWWISNIVRVDATPARIAAIAARDDVERVYLNHPIELIRPVGRIPAAAGAVPVGAIEPGVVAVRAPEAWALGFDGTGTLVSTLDTGVDGNHPAVGSRWKGLDPDYLGHPEWAFFDPVTGWTFPQDSGSHGTHTMGTTCGGAPGDQIGVAPGAQWIHAAVIDRVSIAQTVSDAIDAFQWLIDPDEDPATSTDVPDTCSNSWGLADFHGYPDCDETFWSFIDACEAAGIVVLFSAGNEGPSPNSVRRPADRGTDEYRNMAVAAVDGNVPSWPIASFSSRGPTDCGPLGEPVTKPDIAAPGVSVRSSVPGGGYSNFNGTSMASPHVNGVIALMRQANPEISVNDVKQIIYDTAFDLGDPGEDDDYGYGMIDAFEAVQAALATAGLTFAFPDGLPDLLDYNGGSVIKVEVTGQNSSPQPGTGRLYYSADGGPFTEVPMFDTGPGEFDAIFPPFDCGADVEYYFSVDDDQGETAFNPIDAPESAYAAGAYTGVNLIFRDGFEIDWGWTVEDGPGLTAGSWENLEPEGANEGEPAEDFDGTGPCFATGLAGDVDGGATMLTSPDLDASDPGTRLIYHQWYYNGDPPADDVLVVEVSDDGGASWTTLETVGPDGPGVTGGWERKEWLVADIPGIVNSSNLRMRVTASDTGVPSTVEAAIDAIEVSAIYCTAATCPDIDGDGEVGIEDFLLVLGAWGPNPGHPADLDGDGEVGIEDFLLILANWGECP